MRNLGLPFHEMGPKYAPGRVGAQCQVQSQPWPRPPLRVTLMLQPGSRRATVSFFGTLVPLLCQEVELLCPPLNPGWAHEHAD